MQNLSIDHADCLHSTTQFWQTIVINTCSQVKTTVPHGVWDMALYLSVSAFLVGAALMMFSMSMAIIFSRH